MSLSFLRVTETDEAVAKARQALQSALRTAEAVDLSRMQPEPEPCAWTLTADALRLMVALVRHLRPAHILEFGSGLSTRVLAWACFDADVPCHISSIDHDPDYKSTTEEQIRTHADSISVAVHLAPLVVREFVDEALPVYRFHPELVASHGAVDLIVIDGPPLLLGGRRGVLYQAMEFARPGTLVLLDDAHRAEEAKAMATWHDEFADAIEVSSLAGFTKGMAVVLIRAPVPAKDLERHRIEILKKELASLLPADSAYILVDDNQWADIEIVPGCNRIPFLERNGEYWGAPQDDKAAIDELMRLRREGAHHIVIAWPAFWWLDYYTSFSQFLHSNFRCELENRRLVVFSLVD